MLHVFNHWKRAVLFCADTCFIAISYFLAFCLRFEYRIPDYYFRMMLATFPVLFLMRFFFLIFFQLYRGMWGFASVKDLINIIKASLFGVMAFIVYIIFFGKPGFPRSIFLIDTGLVIMLMGGLRIFLRIMRERKKVRKKNTEGNAHSVLIIGAGDTGNMVLNEMKQHRSLNYHVIGFLDDSPFKQGALLQGVAVLGKIGDLQKVCAQKGIPDEIMIAIPSATSEEMSRIVQLCYSSVKTKVTTVPALSEMLKGTILLKQVHEVKIEDLLGREKVEIDTHAIAHCIKGKKILITGAGGSIGSELCRQVVKFAPVSIILLGRGEHSIFQIHQEMSRAYPTIQFYPVIGDVINKKKVEYLLATYHPDIIYHAAADKHVPLMELNPDEAVLNNIIGTHNVIEASAHYNVERVVCISTDKAANPESVMGCSKNIAEQLICQKEHPVTKYIAVRFGNVLGSRGSVIPIFKEQIARGGPITVTDKRMTRYFMTIPEAAQLVIQAGFMEECGKLFLLDMGKPVNIAELAKKMILLSGYAEGDIRIHFIGLRPGERLEETLTGKGEILQKTPHPKILSVEKQDKGTTGISSEDIEILKQYAIEMDEKAIINKLYELCNVRKEK